MKCGQPRSKFKTVGFVYPGERIGVREGIVENSLRPHRVVPDNQSGVKDEKRRAGRCVLIDLNTQACRTRLLVGRQQSIVEVSLDANAKLIQQRGPNGEHMSQIQEVVPGPALGGESRHRAVAKIKRAGIRATIPSEGGRNFLPRAGFPVHFSGEFVHMRNLGSLIL